MFIESGTFRHKQLIVCDSWKWALDVVICFSMAWLLSRCGANLSKAIVDLSRGGWEYHFFQL